MTLVMLAIDCGSLVPLVAQMPLASAPRYSSPPATAIAEAPVDGRATAAAAGTVTGGFCVSTSGALTGAVSAHHTYPLGTASSTTSTIAVTIQPMRRRRR